MNTYALDVTNGIDNGHVWVPIEKFRDGRLMFLWGLSVVRHKPPGEVLHVIHREGNDAAYRFINENRDAIQGILR